MLRNNRLTCAALMASGLISACTLMGSGHGESDDGDTAIDFSWTSESSTAGMMTASLEQTGQTFRGKFFQITSETRIDDLGPLWNGWYRPWTDWPYWAYDSGPRFMTHYSGRVVANLETADGEHLRCSFDLVHPSSGMSGGGEGRCQGSDGKTIHATFPAG